MLYNRPNEVLLACVWRLNNSNSKAISNLMNHIRTKFRTQKSKTRDNGKVPNISNKLNTISAHHHLK